MDKYFDYQSKYAEYKNCYFRVGKYINGNLAVEIWNDTDGPITKVTVNPDIYIPTDRIAIKNYSENSGIVEWLISKGIIEEDSTRVVISHWVSIPVHKLTEKGKQMMGL